MPRIDERALISPEARSLAEERGLGWRFLPGSGESGQVEPADILAYEVEVSALGVTPAARALAAKRQIDLREVPPTGPGGRVSEDDVRNAAALPAPELESYTLTIQVVFARAVPENVPALLKRSAAASQGKLKNGAAVTVAAVNTPGVEPVSALSANPRAICLICGQVAQSVTVAPGGEMVIRPTARITGCFDGRAVDLPTAEAFMAEVKSAMEKQ